MKMKKLALLLIGYILISCEQQVCFTHPELVNLNLTNSEGQNLITSDKLKFSEIKVVEKSTNKSENIRLIEDNYISLENAGWQNGTKHYVFYTPLDTFNLSITAREVDSKNCGGYVIDVLELDRESKEENGIIKVVLKP
jgi:hypothetical protein